MPIATLDDNYNYYNLHTVTCLLHTNTNQLGLQLGQPTSLVEQYL